MHDHVQVRQRISKNINDSCRDSLLRIIDQETFEKANRIRTGAVADQAGYRELAAGTVFGQHLIMFCLVQEGESGVVLGGKYPQERDIGGEDVLDNGPESPYVDAPCVRKYTGIHDSKRDGSDEPRSW